MRINLLLLILFASTAAHSQLIINTTIADSILYNAVNYVTVPSQFTSEVILKNASIHRENDREASYRIDGKQSNFSITTGNLAIANN